MDAAGTVVILAAGESTRFLSAGPKVLQPVCGRPLLAFVLDQARALAPQRIVLVVGHRAAQVRAAFEGEEGLDVVVQEPRLGTGHAVAEVLRALEELPDPVVVLYGDMPLVEPTSLRALLARLETSRAAVLTTHASDPRGFGRILRDARGEFTAIVEEADASPEQRAIDEVNLGVYAFRSDDLVRLVPSLERDNAQGEYYLTDVVGRLAAEGQRIGTVVLADEREAIGVNTLAHLAEARRAIQERILERHLANGVLVEDPATTYVDFDVEIGRGTRILPCTVIREGVRIGEGCEVGPFTHLRAGTVLEDGAEVGNFTEAKKAHVGSGTKAKHLTYLGDVEIGPGSNIGAGTIVANYDGARKHRTEIGARAFVGSGSILIAPCSVGEGALTGAGAVVTRGSRVPPGAAWVGVPARQLRGPSGEPSEGSGGEA